MAIAEHSPEDLSAKNAGLKKMSHKQLHEFAATSEKHLPEHVHSRASYSMARKARNNG